MKHKTQQEHWFLVNQLLAVTENVILLNDLSFENPHAWMIKSFIFAK